MSKLKIVLKNKNSWIFVGLIILGIFLRGYEFSSWLHFELDQARDAIIIDEAVDGGIGELTLLGPRAAGTKLRLGPSFYYFEYVGALISGDTVVGSAYVALFFSVLSMPLMYFLLRRYFSKKIALSLLGVFASSVFLVTYARFAWNPNLIPFFVLAVTYCLLRSVDKEEGRRGWYLILTAVAFAFLSHLHFLALIILSVTSAAFLLYKRPRIQLKFWLAAVGVFAFINIPMIVNEIKTGGENFSQFMGAVGEKSEETEVGILEKALRNYTEHSLWYEIVISGNEMGKLPVLDRNESGFDIKCAEMCRKHSPIGLLALLFFTFGLLLMISRAFKEKDIQKKDFLVLNLILFGVSFVVFTPLSYDLSPRFFLVGIIAPFVFLGLIFNRILRFKRGENLAILLAAFLVFSNLFFVAQLFEELRLAKSESIDIGKDKILNQKTRITLEQQKEIVEYLKKRHKENGYPIFMKGQNEFHRSFAYHLDKEGIVRDGISMNDIYEEGNYFMIMRTQSDMNRYYERYGVKFDFVSKKEFGTLTVFELVPKPHSVNKKSLDLSEVAEEREEIEQDKDDEARRYKWKEIFE